MIETAPSLSPVRGRERIDVLDILRGIAILGIFYMNIPFMGANAPMFMEDIRRIGWTAADQVVWSVIAIFWSGTQRGLFEFLFGAGVMVLTARAMRPDGPVAIADLFYRRNLWLIVFGLLDIFIIGWIGDILLVYGLAALFVFPFRKLSARVLIPLGLLWAAATAIGLDGQGGALAYAERAGKMEAALALQEREQGGEVLGEAEAETLSAWQTRLDRFDLARPLSEETAGAAEGEAAIHSGGPGKLLAGSWFVWHKIFWAGNGTFFGVVEAVCAMFLGMALWKLGIIQGEKSMRFYALMALAGYAVGCGLRAWGVSEAFAFSPAPKIYWITYEIARLSVTLGHVALVNLLVKSATGKAVLSPFKAAGRTAFSLYVLTSVLGIWVIFAPWGLGLWGRFGWAELALVATIVNAGLLVLANVWVRRFANGPLEWAWRSLAYWKRQPFLRHAGERPIAAVPGTELNPPLPR